MEETAVWERLTGVFREMFEDPALTVGPGTTARDVEGWDSLMHIQLLVATERAFQIRFNTGEVAGLANVGEMVALIVRRLGSRKGS